MVVRLAIAALVSLSGAMPTLAQETDPFSEALAEAVLPIEMDHDGALSGDGYDLLMADAAQSQFFMIGEQHAAREIAQAELAMLRDLQTGGFDHFVVELGPYSTRYVERLIREGLLVNYIRTPGQQFLFPFIFFEEEADLVEQWVNASDASGNALWGVDQEFLGAGPVLLELLSTWAESNVELNALANLQAGIAANPMYLGAAPQADMDALALAFADGSQDAQDLVEAIYLTHHIYGPFMRGSGPIYPANLERENYMKRNFLAHFEAAEEEQNHSPRIVFKFGGNHLQRGFTTTDVPAFGNFIAEWGSSRMFSTTNIMIDCMGGETFGITQGGPTPCQNYYIGEDATLAEMMGDERMVLVDMRSLRPHLGRARDLDPQFRTLILAYDYYLLIRNVTPQTPLADLTLPGM